MKNLPLIVGVIVVVGLAVGGYMFMKRPSSQTAGEDSQETQQQASGGMMSLKDLMALGQNQMCTFSTSSDDGTVNGTTYVSGGKIRTDFNGTYADGNAYEGSMINDGSYVYTWTTDTNQGFKMAYTDNMEQAVEDSQQNQNQYIDPNEKVDYTCSGWNGDSTKFIPPTDITFTDYSEMMQMMEQSTSNDSSSDVNAAQCAACDSLPEGEAKNMCKQSLGC